MGYRARSLAKHLSEQFYIHIAYRSGNKLAAILQIFRFLSRTRPDVTYVFDMAYSGVFAAWFHRLFFRNNLIIETGDVIHELMRSTGNRGRLGLWLTRWLENFSLRQADSLVVRGREHQQHLKQLGLTSHVVQDGVDSMEFQPLDAGSLRQKLGLNKTLTVGLVGSSIWSEKLGICYGWELIELLRQLPDGRVHGVVIGDGTGIPHLKDRCRQYGIEDRVHFLGFVPYPQLPLYLNLIDVCLSTQTNDLVGRVRTSGKLPLYLATGRYVLASAVGEAAVVLDAEMLVPYDGVRDLNYPGRLAERVTQILAAPQRLERGRRNISVAKERFEYSVLAKRLSGVIQQAMKNGVQAASATSPRHGDA